MLPGIFHVDIFHSDIYRTGPDGRADDDDDLKTRKDKRYKRLAKQLEYEDIEMLEIIIIATTSGLLEE